MPALFFILIIIVCVILGLLVLVQNPKGGGLSGTFGGMGNQIMGVKQTTDVLEKGTWLFSGLIALLCVVSVLFFRGSSSATNDNMLNNINTNAPAQQKTAPMTTPVLPQAADTTKK